MLLFGSKSYVWICISSLKLKGGGHKTGKKCANSSWNNENVVLLNHCKHCCWQQRKEKIYERIHDRRALSQSKREHCELYGALCEGVQKVWGITKYAGHFPKLSKGNGYEIWTRKELATQLTNKHREHLWNRQKSSIFVYNILQLRTSASTFFSKISTADGAPHYTD